MTHTRAAVAVLKAYGQPMAIPDLLARVNEQYQTGTTMETLCKLTKRLAQSGALGRHPGPVGVRPPQSVVWYLKDPVLYVKETALTEQIMRWVEVESATYDELVKALNVTHKQLANAVMHLAQRNRVVIRKHARAKMVDLPERVAAAMKRTAEAADTPYRTVWRPYPSTFGGRTT